MNGKKKKRRLLHLGLLLPAGICLFDVGAGFPLQDPGERVEETRTVLEKWIETRRVISREKRDWALGKELLTERIDLVRREIKTLRARIDEAQESITETEGRQTDLQGEKEKLKAAAKTLQGTVETMESRTLQLLKRLPEPLRERVQPLSQRIPRPGKESLISLGERFQNVVGILNEINKFNGEITVATEVRDLGRGRTAQVTTLYIGIGQAYYASMKGDAAGVGRPTEEGWAWIRMNGAAPLIQEAIAVYKNEKPATFVGLPVQIK